MVNEITYTDTIKPVCLAKSEEIIVGGKATYTGWGNLESGNSDLSLFWHLKYSIWTIRYKLNKKKFLSKNSLFLIGLYTVVNRLREVTVDIMALDDCKTSYSGLTNEVQNTNVCTLTPGKDACQVCIIPIYSNDF